jgi:hypothetical protein
MWINEWVWFDRVVLFLIVANSILLAMNDYSFREKGGSKTIRNDIVDGSELWFQICFSLEATVKIIAMGFITETGSYLRDPWNVLDFIVVAIGWVGLLPGITNLTALRAIRVLRPLRSISMIPDMKILVNSLIKSIPGLFHVIIFLMFMILVFGIVGVNFFRGLNY